MMSIGIDVDLLTKTVREVQTNLKKVTSNYLKKMYWEMFSACEELVVPRAKEYAPTSEGALWSEWAPGTLKDSIEATPVGTGAYKNRVVSVHDGVDYGIHHEMGFFMSQEMINRFIRMKRAKESEQGWKFPSVPAKGPHWVKNPFLVPAVDESEREIIDRMKSVMK